jgi:hypothetical protein
LPQESNILIGRINAESAEEATAETKCARRADATNVAEEDISREIAPDAAHTLTHPGLDLVLIQVEVEVPAEIPDITEEQAAEEMTDVMTAEDAEEVQVTQEAQVRIVTADAEEADQQVTATAEAQDQRAVVETNQWIQGTKNARVPAEEEAQVVIINQSPHIVIAKVQHAMKAAEREPSHQQRSTMVAASKRRAQLQTELLKM